MGALTVKRIVARLLVLLPLLWVVLCASAHGAEQIDQITLERAASDDAVNALRASDQDILRARSGDTLVLYLADSGPYRIRVDTAGLSTLGNTVIKGATPSGGSSLMVIGRDGSVRGHFERAGETVQVSSDDDGVISAWIEGVDATMLPINDEVIFPPDDARGEVVEPTQEPPSESLRQEPSAESDSEVTQARFDTGEATIRILIYYEDAFTAIETVADYLVELTNVAFEESAVVARLEIAALKSVSFDSPVLVASVLSSMWSSEAPFENIEEELSAEDADMAATLVVSRDDAEYAAGIAYTGAKFKTQRFSVTRYYGDYQSGEPLTPSYTFAHEIGHNLGAGHNREQYSDSGQGRSTFSYAFGYLIEGVQRTIMSYRSASFSETRIPRFSHPDISYNGYPTGISSSSEDSAFTARAFQNNRHVAVVGKDADFKFERVRYVRGDYDGVSACGTYRYVRMYNDTRHPIVLASRTYMKPDGSVDQYSDDRTVEPGDSSWVIALCSQDPQHPLGTIYTETYFNYYHPLTGDLVKSPVFPWSETFIDRSEVRIAYSDGGQPVGATRRYLRTGETADVTFGAARGFSLDTIVSTCEGSTLADGFRVTGTADDCLLEASFSDDRVPPGKPTVTGIDAGDGVASLSVNVSDDGGADVTRIFASCSYEDTTHTGESATSPVLVAGMRNGLTYECSARAENLKGTGAESDAVSVTLPQTMPAMPMFLRTDYGDGQLLLFIDNSSQPTTLDSFIATCTDGTNTYTGTSTTSPVTVSGLTNGVAYTCTVTATNSVGTSSASAATASIIPEATATGLPIWLLYQATQ